MTVIQKREELSKRYKDFVSDINDLTLRDKLNQVPSEKAFWAMVLTDYERALAKLESKRDKMIKSLSNEIVGKAPVVLTKIALDNVKNDESLQEINENIQELKLCVSLFSKIYDNVRYIARDFENILKFKQLQEL
jgi:dTDP-4-amino-4,6-dideoxygalactose transaminase